MIYTNIHPEQHGYQSLGIWVGPVDPQVGVLPTKTAGIQFLVPANTYTWRSIKLSLTPNAGGGTGTFRVYLCSDIDEAFFSGLNLPGNANVIRVYQATETLAVGVTTTVELNFGVDENPGYSYPIGYFVGAWQSPMQTIGHSDWNGRLCLVMYFSVDTTFTAATITLTGDVEPLIGSLPTNKHRMSRADVCQRCGRPGFREQFVRDGFVPSLLVCKDCWDRAERRYPPFTPLKEINP